MIASLERVLATGTSLLLILNFVLMMIYQRKLKVWAPDVWEKASRSFAWWWWSWQWGPFSVWTREVRRLKDRKVWWLAAWIRANQVVVIGLGIVWIGVRLL